MPLPNWIAIVHGIERCNLIHPHWRHLQYSSDLIHYTQARESMLSLSEIENWHDGSFLVLWRVAFEDLFDELVVLLRKLEGNIGIVLGRIAML